MQNASISKNQPLSKTGKKLPSQLIKDQKSGRNMSDQHSRAKIIQHFNITDNSIYSDSQVDVNEPLFRAEPNVIQFTDYEPLQVKEQVLRLRNKDKVARSVKIVPPDSKLFQVQPCKKSHQGKTTAQSSSGFKDVTDIDNMSCRVAPGMEISYIIKFAPEAKSDYTYDLNVLTEREKFVVPVRAVGCRSMIDFPDILDFGQVPVKHVTEKPVMIRNVGEKGTKWKITIPNGIELSKQEGILEVGQTEQLIFKFIPQESRTYKEELVLTYDGLDATVPILGESHNDDVHLSKSHIHMDPTSITLYSHQYYTIVNKSQVPIEFSWRAFATDKEENEKKSRLNMQLTQEEAEERAMLEGQDHMESGDDSLDSDDSYDEGEMALKRARVQEKAVATLQRKYQGIRQAVEDDPMLFQDEIFTIEPLQGKIWPNTEITCCVTFKPQGPYHYSCTAFCNTTCSEERLALNMTGQGKGPQAQLSLPEQDIGDIFVNYKREFAVGIENTGEIDCHWKLIPFETPFGSKFQFSKTEGILGVNQDVRDLIKVTFKSDILGEFSETFRFALEGSSEMLTLTFKGHVVAPTFKFSEEVIDFGRVSQKFPINKSVYLTNTSEVDIHYVVRVPGDGRSPGQAEFNITNERGCLERSKEAKIDIEFVPAHQQQYDMVLVVDLEGVGQDMLAVPIKADCDVPPVEVTPSDFLEYGECFLRHEKTMYLEIVNKDPLLQAKYEIVPQDDPSKRIAVYTADKPSGIINKRSTQRINIALRTEILSAVRIPMYIKVEGHPIPFMVTILATSRGPEVTCDRTELEFAPVTALVDETRKVTIKNESQIPAEYTAFTKQKESIWKVIQRHGILQPEEERDIEIVCHADELQKFSDTLHIIINNGEDLEVALKATKVTGSTLACKENLDRVDFGTEYTHQEVSKEFFLENRGRKQMRISWVRTTGAQRREAKKPEAKTPTDDKKKDKTSESVATATETKEEEEAKPVFAVLPETMVLNPKMGYKVRFRALSANTGDCEEAWACQISVGGDRKPQVAFTPKVSGCFIQPSLNFSEQTLAFKYQWEKGVASMPITRQLSLSNGSSLPTTVSLRIEPPFSCATQSLTLTNGEPETVSIDFDPGATADRLSDNISRKLTIAHLKPNSEGGKHYPHVDTVALSGELCFPNLAIEPDRIDFGCILNDTNKRKYLVLKNVSAMPVNYEWSFLEEENDNLNAVMEEDESKKKKKKKANPKAKALPVNEVFDILPVSGRLGPGQTENVEFTYSAGMGLLYNGTAVCSVDGGPDYAVAICGESSYVGFKLSTTELDFGEIAYSESSQQDFFIENIGKVPFAFNINLSTVSRPGLIEVSHMSGKVPAGDRQRVAVKFFPGVPDNIDEMLLVECGHFPAVRFKVKAVGTYPGALLSFPRAITDEHLARLERAKGRREQGAAGSAYLAPFGGAEALRLMPARDVPTKLPEREKALLKEAMVPGMEAEAEADRELLCQLILAKLEQEKGMAQTQASGFGGVQKDLLSSTRGSKPAKATPKAPGSSKKTPGAGAAAEEEAQGPAGGVGASIENIHIATYTCDFGDVVVGNTKRKSFRLTNVGRLPVNFNFDKKILGQAGISIEPDKAQKMPPNSSQLFTVIYATRKNAKFGKQKMVIPVDVKGGPSYSIEFGANLTIPELTMSSDTLDFGKVCIQNRKTVKVRFENQKEVACDWSYHFKADVTASAGAKDGERFHVFPQGGTLQPGQRQTVDIMFTPSNDKAVNQKLNFRCKDNSKQFVLTVKGHGINYQVDLVPEVAQLGPVLPYDTSAVQCIELRNPMEQAIEVLSQDFDSQYLEEEEILKRLDQFQGPQPDPLFLSLRAPGGEFWPALREQDDRRRRGEELEEKLAQIEEELVQLDKDEEELVKAKAAAAEQEEGSVEGEPKEGERTVEQVQERRTELTAQKGQLEASLAEQKEDQLEVAFAAQVKEEDKLNIVIIGPEKSGRTTLANYLAQEHQRGVVRMDQLYDWCKKRGSPLAEEASKHLAARQDELAGKLAEQEKRRKAKKTAKDAVVPDVVEADFDHLPEDILAKMLRERLAQEDCNAGAIFDCLESDRWRGEQAAVAVICEALRGQNLQLMLLKFQKDPEGVVGGEGPADVCTNYRFARRREGVRLGDGDAKAQAEGDGAGKRAKSKQAARRGGRRGAQGAAKEEEERPQEEIDAERKKAEQEEKKRLEEIAREQQKPKDYSSEEVEAYNARADEMEQFFAGLTLRQSAGKEQEAEVNEDGDAVAAGTPAEEKAEDAEKASVAEASEPKAAGPAHGKRILVPQFIEYDFKYLCDSAKAAVPEPVWPDPDKEPLPAPVTHQVVRRPVNRPERKEITLFSIWTPEAEAEKAPASDDGQPAAAGEEPEEAEEALPEMQKGQARWVLGPKEVKKIYVKFFSKRVGAFAQVLKFEIVGSTRAFELALQAGCEFPTINSGYRNVFMTHRKTRPHQQPESLLAKTFVVSENTFDFGPLLIKKDPERRSTDATMRKVNSSELQITNNGKYKAAIAFTLASTLPSEEGGAGDKSPFILEPESLELEVDETKALTVFAFPEQARLYKDEIVCLLQDNPNPTIFSIQALGSEPGVEVDQEVVPFDRLLLGKKLTKTLTLKNVCPIPTNWKLSGVDALPKEFTVSHTSGTLAPCQEQVIEIQFEAIADNMFEPNIQLEVEDVEGNNIQQEAKVIKLQAEAFNISPTVTIGNSEGQLLDYGAVRVGDPKENTITIKNDGKYSIKYSFTRKKKQTREIFAVEPEADELKPGDEKTIIVRFLSQKEIKLKTTTQTSDLVLNILEGESQDVHQPIPINVNVNAVFSKYSITPLKTINFGPMQYGEQVARSFEVRNEGLFEFKYSICDDKDLEAKAQIKEERKRETDERINGAQEATDDPKAAAKGGKKPDAKAAKGGKAPAGGAGAPAGDGTQLTVGQYDVTPATGSIPPGNAAVVSVTFRAEGAKFYESTLALDIADRDPADQPDGLPFELCAESSIPGINTHDLDQVFEEQTVIPSLDPSLNTQTIISSSLFSTQERIFWFGTLVASKNPEGARERFKIMNPNKIPCTVKFAVKNRSNSKGEGFAFEVTPDTLTIDPHKHKYVTVAFNPTAMMTYGGIFEAIVENGDPESKSGKLVCELRGEGTLPTLLVEKPEEVDAEGTPILRFRKTRIGRESTLQIVLKNEGGVPATARFDALQHDCFTFMGNLSHTITPKSYHAFDILFSPKQSQSESFLLTFSTIANPYEQHKVLITGEGYSESVTFEGLPEDELGIGDCIVGKQKTLTFQLANNGDKPVRFNWNTGEKEEFKLFPAVGHLQAQSTKDIKVAFKSLKAVQYDQIELHCETVIIEQKADEDGASARKGFKDWDDTMKTVRMVRPSELKKIMAERDSDERRRREEAEAAQAAAAKGGKGGKAPTKAPAKAEGADDDFQIDESEEATAELVDTVKEPEHEKAEGSERAVALKTSLVCDYSRYECATTKLEFKPTLMYAQRTHKFAIKNTSLINLHFNFKITNESGDLDAGAYSIFPKKGSIAPGCDDNFLVKFAPMEIENDFSRIVQANFQHLDPEQSPLEIVAQGIAERPVIHFELPPSAYKDRKEKDMTPIDSKFKIIEFESLGTSIRNTRRFMTVNPTSQGYEFEWEEVQDEARKAKPLFKCLTQRGVILSGKKAEMVFEYIPDSVGEHESQWVFRIPAENIVQHFLVVGRVCEPNVLFETGKIKFGPLLLQGKNREVVSLINQEHIPFSFNFSKESVKGSPDFGESLKVSPMTGVVPAQSQVPVEVLFQPKYELQYNYNLICNVKRKARPLVLNVKGEGYKIHHNVFAGSARVDMKSGEPHKFEFGEFFINERKTKNVVVQNNGDFNFDFVWKRQVNKYITINPDTGSVPKGESLEFEITYLPLAEHHLKNYKLQLQIVSGPKYDFILLGKARKPGIKLSSMTVDFGPCFVSRTPVPFKKMLVAHNVDSSAISIETDFEKQPHLDVQLTPGQVLMPETPEAEESESKLQIPILFTPREFKSYQETVTLDFNGLYKVDVLVKGEGIPLHLDLKDPDQAFIDFGIVSVGGDVTKTVALANKSKKPVTFKLLPSNANLFQKCNLAFAPDKEVTLKPREVLPVEVRFNPKVRLPNFNLEVMLSVEPNEPRKLISVHGVSHGIELKLMDEVLAFGSVVRGSRLSKIVQFSNFGDVKAHFKWAAKIYGKNFTITPESGYINPNSNLDLEVTFHPSRADPDIRYNKVPCVIKGGDQLELSLMGKSVDQDTSTTEEISFQTKVRQENTQSVTVQNTEDKEWAINPTISTEDANCSGYFSGKSTLIVPARGSAQYEVSYTPQTMTKLRKVKQEGEEEEVEEMDTHKGGLFFPLPNGTALLYRLLGSATEPVAEGDLTETVTAKKAKSIIIPVKNWARTAQRFHASWEVEGEADPALFIRGANAFDVAASSTKQFKLNFLSLRAGQYRFKATFKAVKTGEYAFFNVAVTVEEPELIATIELASQVRESVSQVISIENPTDSEVVMHASEFKCDNEYIEMTPPTVTFPPKSERGFEVHYRPLIASSEDLEEDLTLTNELLGTFKYKLLLKGLQPSTQRSLAFKCALGNELMQAFKFTHFQKKATTYTVAVERLDPAGAASDFKAESGGATFAPVQAPAAENHKGVELSCNIKYEPSTIGDSRGVLKLKSAEGMDYTCLLYGKATAPQPQGPFKCPVGAKPAAIDFKNPLSEKCEFVVTFDNANFSLASKLPGPLDPGKNTSLQVKFDGKPDLPRTGRMMVNTKGLPPWIFYLQGE